MQKKDIKLFDRAIHKIKNIIKDLHDERNEYRKQLAILTKRHDKKTNKMLREGKEVLDEMYELFDDLTDKKGN